MPRPFTFPSTRLHPLLLSMLLASAATAASAQTQEATERTVASVQADVVPAPIPEGSSHHASAPAPTAASDEPSVHREAAAQPLHRIAIGSATQRLFDMQSTLPGLRPRHIDGEQASRSYQRYLKSFETTIPEQYETGVSAK